jgi:hypothetical protein
MAWATRLPKSIDDIDGAWLSEALHARGLIAQPEGVVVTGVKPVPGGTAFATIMAILELDGPPGTPSSVVVKIPTTTEIRQLMDGIGGYLREVTFYSELAKDCPVRVPEPYVVKMAPDSTDFVLVMEDLSHLKTPDQITGLTIEQATAAVDALGIFHAWCWEHDRLKAFEDIFPPLDSERATAINGGLVQYFGDVWQRVRALPMVNVEAKQIGDHFAELMPFFTEQLSTPRTLSHGELRADNFFLLPDGGLLMVDFQSLAQQAGIIDVAYIISQSIDEDVRRGYDEQLISRYHERLIAEGVSDYSLEHAWHQYRIAVAYNLMFPVLAFVAADTADERGKQLMAEMLARAADTIRAVDALELLPI